MDEDSEDEERNGGLDHFMEKLRPTAEISCDGLLPKVGLAGGLLNGLLPLGRLTFSLSSFSLCVWLSLRFSLHISLSLSLSVQCTSPSA